MHKFKGCIHFVTNYVHVSYLQVIQVPRSNKNAIIAQKVEQEVSVVPIKVLKRSGSGVV